MIELNWSDHVRHAMRAALVCGVMVMAVGCETVSKTPPGEPSNPFQSSRAQKTLNEAAREAEAANKYEMAAGIYGRLVEGRPNDPVILSAFVRNMRYSGRSREIVDYVQTKAAHLLGQPQVKFEYGKALLAAGRKTAALGVLNESRAQMPDNWRVYSAIGIADDALGRFEEAIAAYTMALKLSPDNVVVMNNMAMSQAMSGKLADAIRTLERAAGINRNNAHVRQNLALLYAINGDVERARALASMDLDMSDVETNLSFYRRFEGHSQ